MDDFKQQFADVSPVDRKLLQILSVFWMQITATDFRVLLRILGLRTPEDIYFSSKYLADFRKSLIEKGILDDTQEYWGKGFQIVNPELKEYLTREASRTDWFSEVVEAIQSEFGMDGGAYWFTDKEINQVRLMRDFRICIYQEKKDRLGYFLEEIEERECTRQVPKIVVHIFSNPFQAELLRRFDQEFQTLALLFLLEDALESALPTAEFWKFVRETGNTHQLLQNLEIEELIYKGEISRAKKLIGEPDMFATTLMRATIALLEQDFETSVEYFELAIKAWRKTVRKRKGFPAEWQMFSYGLALFKTDEAKFYAFAAEAKSYANKNPSVGEAFWAIEALDAFLKNQKWERSYTRFRTEYFNFSDWIIEALVSAIIPSFELPKNIEKLSERVGELGFRWLEMELNNLIAVKGESGGKEARAAAGRLQSELGFAPVGNIIPPIEDWQRVINALSLVTSRLDNKETSKAKTSEKRIVWQLDFERRSIQPLVQTYGKSGWTKGRNISLKKLFDHKVKNLTQQDLEVVKNSMKRERDYSYYGSDFYEFSWQKAIPHLVGHPNLFLSKNPAIGVQLIGGEPTLIIKEVGDAVELSFDIGIKKVGCAVKKETETRYKVIEINSHHLAIAESFRHGRTRVPAEGTKALMKAIQPLSTKIAIQSDLEEFFEKLPTVEAENRIHALITPVGDGFHLEFFSKPFGSVPPYFKPGKGKESVIVELDGVRTRTKRDLQLERGLLDEIEASCPFLSDSESPNYEWNLSDPESCLRALSEMEVPREKGKLVIEWTKGQKLKFLGNVSYNNFSVNVKGKNDWFEVSGEVKVNEELVLSMKELSGFLDRSKGEFVELSDGQFIAITEKLRQHLQSINSALDDKQRLHHLRSGVLSDFAEELENFKANKAWKDHVAKLDAVEKFVPELPSTFQAELRPYQIDGYMWLSRLAAWGVGACLADDMGLGKTLQALAIMAERAEKGAALVVAPVSVCRNWVNEARRFAPTLNFQIFGEGDRKVALESLGKFDVLVTSYNLLQLEEKLFTKKEFSTIVLDEAQAIKNRTTKRSKTVMNLKGDFRLITTGTPIENHLGELWNLFNFINPGLLGNFQSFNEKFALPIERNDDKRAHKTLQRLIKPFILRRLKNQVLDDLPEKTEIKLTVELSEEERAFYEATRRSALEKIEETEGEAKDKRFRIFAELTRLRLACCHPKLVDENSLLSGSKLELFGETIAELLDNNHKALVFSQFVKHLKIVKEYLNDQGISFQYLDGSTPQKKRQERIDAFQAGKGDVFLISLKAGGTGLNLTAADYVIHLDPWWNPAVEDQATDRVHRIGQKRPVTVYRLVTENSVEEKILRLHDTKRHLADSLLSEADSSSKLTAEDLLALIREN